MSETTSSQSILAATFTTPDGGSRAAGAVVGAFPDRVSNAAVLWVKPDGSPKFTETKEVGATGKGALIGGAIGLIAGPLGVIAGGTIGALVAHAKDKGFENAELAQLGRTLSRNDSAVVFALATDALPEAQGLLVTLGPAKVVALPIEARLASVFE